MQVAPAMSRLIATSTTTIVSAGLGEAEPLCVEEGLLVMVGALVLLVVEVARALWYGEGVAVPLRVEDGELVVGGLPLTMREPLLLLLEVGLPVLVALEETWEDVVEDMDAPTLPLPLPLILALPLAVEEGVEDPVADPDATAEGDTAELTVTECVPLALVVPDPL